MEKTAARLLELRQSVNLTQAKMAVALGLTQSSLNRYEHDQAIISDEVIYKYAEYFDVSLDYICGRTDKPEGILFSGRPKIENENEELRQFIEFCFDPTTKMNRKLKDALYQLMSGGDEA